LIENVPALGVRGFAIVCPEDELGPLKGGLEPGRRV